MIIKDVEYDSEEDIRISKYMGNDYVFEISFCWIVLKVVYFLMFGFFYLFLSRYIIIFRYIGFYGFFNI